MEELEQQSWHFMVLSFYRCDNQVQPLACLFKVIVSASKWHCWDSVFRVCTLQPKVKCMILKGLVFKESCQDRLYASKVPGKAASLQQPSWYFWPCRGFHFPLAPCDNLQGHFTFRVLLSGQKNRVGTWRQ